MPVRAGHSIAAVAGGKLAWDDTAAMFVPAAPLPGITCVGTCAGSFDFDAAIGPVQAAGRGADPPAPVGGLGRVPADKATPETAKASLARRAGKVFIDLQNDVTQADVALAARENYRSVGHLKRHTAMGMATDQGKTSNINALVQMAKHTQRTPPQVGTTKFRPPFTPVTLNALAAGRSGERSKPLRRLPAHGFHTARGALMEEFGGWLRPAAYPRSGKSVEHAAGREATHMRRTRGAACACSRARRWARSRSSGLTPPAYRT